MVVELKTDKWVNQYSDYLYALAVYKIRDEDLAKDLVQETFLSALKSVKTFRGDCSEKTWLVRILNNKIIDHYRKSKKEIPISTILENTESSFTETFFDTRAETYGHGKKEYFNTLSGLDSESKLDQAELKRILDMCLERLPKYLSQIFLMKHFCEEKTEKICKEFDISTSNYWVIIHRAKLLLRDCLAKNWPM